MVAPQPTSASHARFNTLLAASAFLLSLISVLSPLHAPQQPQPSPSALVDDMPSERLVVGQITAPDIADGAVTTYKIRDQAVTSSKIAAFSVTSDKLAPSSVSTVSLSSGAVGHSELAAGAVGAPNVQPKAIGSHALGDNAVTRRAVAPGAVGSSGLGDAAVQMRHLSHGAVGVNQLAGDARLLAGVGAGGTVMWGAVAANGSAASAGEFDASAAADAPGTYTISWRRPFAAPPLLLVSAGTFAICHAQDSTKWQVTVVCLAPGWELSADGHVVSLSNADGRGFPRPSPFTFLALLQ